jgi:predicted P-loop ATPase
MIFTDQPAPGSRNTLIPLDFLVRWGVSLRYDTFTHMVQIQDGEHWVPYMDLHAYQMTSKFHADTNRVINSSRMHEVAIELAHMNKTDGLDDFVKDLPEWDGVSRMDGWLIKHGGAPDTPLVREISRKFLLCMLKRALIPGTKVDTVLILYGKQGIGKSKILSDLGRPYFSDKSISIDRPADAGLGLRGVWLLEFGELDSFRKSEHTRLKAFLSHVEDSFRPPYGRSFETHPRRVVFAGTSNKGDFLSDDTGNRRYWPVPFGEYTDRDGFLRDRDQMLAEARAAVLYDESLQPAQVVHWLESRSEQAADEMRADVAATDPWEELILNYASLPGRVHISMAEVLGDACGLKVPQMDKASELRAAASLRRAGMAPKRIWIGGKLRNRWVRVSEPVVIPAPSAIQSTFDVVKRQGYYVQKEAEEGVGDHDTEEQHPRSYRGAN